MVLAVYENCNQYLRCDVCLCYDHPGPCSVGHYVGGRREIKSIKFMQHCLFGNKDTSACDTVLDGGDMSSFLFAYCTHCEVILSFQCLM